MAGAMCSSAQSSSVSSKLSPARISFTRLKLPIHQSKRPATVQIRGENFRKHLDRPLGNLINAAEGFVHSLWAKWGPLADRVRDTVFKQQASQSRCFSNPAISSLASLSMSNDTDRLQGGESIRTEQYAPRSGRRKGGGIQIGQEGGQEEERVLISEILIQDKDGQELVDSELLTTARRALKACKPNFALTTSEVQEDVHRIIDTGFFASCMPSAEDTRDGVRLIFKVEVLLSPHLLSLDSIIFALWYQLERSLCYNESEVVVTSYRSAKIKILFHTFSV